MIHADERDEIDRRLDAIRERQARVDDSLRDLRTMIGSGPSHGSSQVVVTSSSLGVWVAMLAVLVVMMGMIVLLFVKLDRTQDYLNTIYMQAPHLKPPEEKK